jgi:hypothetical protein
MVPVQSLRALRKRVQESSMAQRGRIGGIGGGFGCKGSGGGFGSGGVGVAGLGLFGIASEIQSQRAGNV